MKYKTFLKNHLRHIQGVSLPGIFTSLAMVNGDDMKNQNGSYGKTVKRTADNGK